MIHRIDEMYYININLLMNSLINHLLYYIYINQSMNTFVNHL